MAGTDPDVSSADRGDIVLGWLVRLVAVLAVVGVLSFDAISIGSSRISIQDQAGAAARAAAENWVTTHDAQSAFDSAWRSATEADAGNEVSTSTFVIDPAGTVHVTVSREAPTFVVRLIGPLRDLTRVRAGGLGTASTS